MRCEASCCLLCWRALDTRRPTAPLRARPFFVCRPQCGSVRRLLGRGPLEKRAPSFSYNQRPVRDVGRRVAAAAALGQRGGQGGGIRLGPARCARCFLCKSLPASTSEPGCVGLRMRLCLLVHGPLDRSTDLMGVAHGGCCSACCCGRRRRRCLGSICVTPRRPGASGVEGGPGGNSGARHLPACPSQTHTHTGRARGPGAQRGGNEGAIGISSRQAGFNHSSKQGPSSPPSVVYYTPPA